MHTRGSRLEADFVRRMLGDWSGTHSMLSSALADALSALIRRGEIPAGTTLPSQRQLSAELGVSRVTVGNAYEILRATGVVDGTARVAAQAA